MAIVQSLEPAAPPPGRVALSPAVSPKRASRVRIGFFNVKFSPNLGDGLLSECLEAELSTQLPGMTTTNLDLAGRTAYSPGRNSRAAALTALHYSPRWVRHAVAETVLGRKLRRDLTVRWRAALRDLDAVVVGGGNLLSDSDLNFPLKLDAALGEARAAGVPAAVFGVGVSDNWSPRGQALFTRALSETPLIYEAVRDDRSADIWRRRLGSAGLGRPQVVHDPALLTAIHFPPQTRGEPAQPLVGLGVTHPIALTYHANDDAASTRDLGDWFVALAAACLTKGWRVAAFTNGGPEDETFLAYLAPRLAALAGPEAISIVPRCANPQAFAAFISGLDLVLAHRLHANIAAYAYGVPQIGFAWDVKLKSFLQQVGRAGCLAVAGRDSIEQVVVLSAQQLDAGVDRLRHGAIVGEARSDVAALADVLLNAVQQKAPSVAESPSRRAATAARSADRLVIVNDFSVARGGATALALLEAELFARRGAPVSFIAGDSGENPELQRLGVDIVPIGQSRLLEAGAPPAALRGLYNRRALAKLAEWIAGNDTPGTIYHLHVWSQVLSPSVFQALAAVRERMLITAHDFFLVCPNGAYAHYPSGKACALTPLSAACLMSGCDKRNYAHKLWRATRQGLQSRLLRFEDGQPTVLMIHEGMREPLQRGGVPDAALRTVANPVRAWRATRVAAEANREFLFVGRLGLEKGPDLAARAARRAGVPLTIIGDGPLRASLEQTFPEVTFTGQLGPEAIAERAATARALLMPSRYPEPYGLVAVEAMWSGIPLVATETALLAAEILRSGAGVVCDPLDERAFADTLTQLARDDEMVRRMSESAFDHTRNLGLSAEAWADELERAFSDVLTSQRRVGATSAADAHFGQRLARPSGS